jgi:hypothetical protein
MGYECQSNVEVEEVTLSSGTENGSGKFMDYVGVVPNTRATPESAK